MIETDSSADSSGYEVPDGQHALRSTGGKMPGLRRGGAEGPTLEALGLLYLARV